MIGEKIIKIMSEVEPVEKTETDEENNYKTAKVEKIIEMVRPLLIKNKVAIIPTEISNFTPQGNRVFLSMKYQIIDLESEEKDYIEVEIPGSGFDEKGGRAVFAALTGAYRYAMQQSFAIPIIDEIKNDGSEGKSNTDENNEEQEDSDNIEIEEDKDIKGVTMDNIEELFATEI